MVHTKIKKFLTGKFVLWIFVPFILFLFWLFGSVFLNPQAKISIISYSDPHVANSLSKERLFKSKTITGEFIAQENHLGIIWLKFEKPPAVDYDDQDTFVFRIKQKGEENWYQVNTYKSGVLYDNTDLPIGFSIIDNSKNKTYIFQIESLNGNISNAISISKTSPSFISSYKTPLSEIFSSNNSLVSFMLKKMVNSFSNVGFLLYSTIYLVPLLYYVLWLIVIRKRTLGAISLRVFSMAIILIDILFIEDLYVGLILCALGFWIISFLITKPKVNISFIAAFTFFIAGIILIPVSSTDVITKISYWSYYMFVIGILDEILLTRNLRAKAIK